LPEGAHVQAGEFADCYPDRFVLIGLSRQLRVLFVVSAEAGDRIRIITARKASPAQRKVYENGP
jgi:uncharacterized DUF497 family protein